MNIYVVVEGPFDAEIIRSTMPSHLQGVVHLVMGGGKSSVLSLARSIISDRGAPLLLVADADTVNEEAISEQVRSFEELLSAVSIDVPYEVVLAVPELETVFFQDPNILERTLQVTINQEDIINAVYQPRKTLESLLTRSPRHIKDRSQFLKLLDKSAIDTIAQHPTIKRINDFLVNTTEETMVASAKKAI